MKTTARVYAWLAVASACGTLLPGCISHETPLRVVRGSTMGGIVYTVKYRQKKADHLLIAQEIDALLVSINAALSTYLPRSDISLLNTQQAVTFGTPYTHEVLSISQRAYKLTGGAFDPTVGALVNWWGFGPTKAHQQRTSLSEGVPKRWLRSVGFETIMLFQRGARRSNPDTYVDLSAIAKGYAVDKVADYLDEHAIQDYMVEVGGEIRCKGGKTRKKRWRIGIEDISSQADASAKTAVVLMHTNYAMATSGNYRNYTVHGGRRYGHIISPQQGVPVEHRLLSASIIARSCAMADAIATACMVIGLESSLQLIREQGLMGIFIYLSAEDTPRIYASAALTTRLAHAIYPVDSIP